MTIICNQCGSPIERRASQCFKRGLRAFCDSECLASFRRTQVGESAHRYTHGGKGTRLYRIWKGIKTRCLNPNFPNYKYYGGRGIRVCNSWRRSFVAFRDWAMQNGYSEGLEIDRRNNDGDYAPRNCRFVTKRANCLNRPTTKRTPALELSVVTLSETMSYVQIAKRLQISKSTVFRIMSDHQL